jgi:CheY-like chemotaxis protein
VDDHPDVLKSLSRLLSFDFEVVGAATSASEALDSARRVPPDIVVMDISMPGRDGLQTARDLKDNGSSAPIVFLTMHESEEFVAQGFRSGGRGYVLKTRLHEDLVTALDRVLSGQLFVPSLGSLYVIEDDPVDHVVVFHPDDQACVEGVGKFLGKALRRGEAVSVVTVEPIRAGLARYLNAQGWPVGELGEFGPYRAIDSADVATAILRDGRPDVTRLEAVVADLEQYRLSNNTGPGSHLTLVGDIATHFLLRGNLPAVIELEQLWTGLTRGLPFRSLCCYSMKLFSDGTHGHLLPDICTQHHAVAHAPEGGWRYQPV